jgi:biotin-dependent carboxylase-like uncharacterized protein
MTLERAAVEVVAVSGLAVIQDGGRPGRMHEGVPPGGALVPEQLARANAAARNAQGEAAIEVVGSIVLRAQAPVVVACDEGDPVELRPGDSWTSASAPRHGLMRYVALRGGVDVPLVLGGRGTLLVAGLGGLEGRPLRRGDVLAAGDAPPREEPPPPPPDLDGPVRVILGPDVDRFEARAVDVLLGEPFAIGARRDRVGIRLAGPTLPRTGDDISASAPMVRGAIQVPASGEAIVLGPDHPTTGGYPVLATVASASLGALAARPVGALVRFALRT